MKACKIILIVLLVLKSLSMIVEALVSDTSSWDSFLFVVFLELPVIWMLYWGAGVLDI